MRVKHTTFYCFSPPVMIATCLIEVGLFVYVVSRYKMSPVVRLAAAMLFFLALFQFAEYNVCGGMGMSAATWSRVGFVAITALPPLGIHLVQTIARKPNKLLTAGAYLTGLAWMGVFGLSEWAFAGHVCSGNYVIFQLRESVGLFYSLYYYGWLFTTIWLSLRWAKTARTKLRSALIAFTAGYLVFLLPTTVVSTLDSSTTAGIPSVMCGFAILFAFILVFAILPKATTKRDVR